MASAPHLHNSPSQLLRGRVGPFADGESDRRGGVVFYSLALPERCAFDPPVRREGGIEFVRGNGGKSTVIHQSGAPLDKPSAAYYR